MRSQTGQEAHDHDERVSTVAVVVVVFLLPVFWLLALIAHIERDMTNQNRRPRNP